MIIHASPICFQKTALDMNPRKQVHKGNESHKSVSAVMKVCHQCAGVGGVLEGLEDFLVCFPRSYRAVTVFG